MSNFIRLAPGAEEVQRRPMRSQQQQIGQSPSVSNLIKSQKNELKQLKIEFDYFNSPHRLQEQIDDKKTEIETLNQAIEILDKRHKLFSDYDRITDQLEDRRDKLHQLTQKHDELLRNYNLTKDFTILQTQIDNQKDELKDIESAVVESDKYFIQLTRDIGQHHQLIDIETLLREKKEEYQKYKRAQEDIAIERLEENSFFHCVTDHFEKLKVLLIVVYVWNLLLIEKN